MLAGKQFPPRPVEAEPCGPVHFGKGLQAPASRRPLDLERVAAQGFRVEVGIKGEIVGRARSLALIRIPEFIAPDDRRIDLLRKAGLDGLRVIGVRPRP